MSTTQIQKSIDRLLKEAGEAVSHLNWELARDLAESALALDEGNTGALAYLAAARQVLKGTAGTGEAHPWSFIELASLLGSFGEVLQLVEVVDNRVSWIATACQQLYGLSQDAFSDDPTLLARIIHPDDAASISALYHDHDLRAGGYVEKEYRIVRPDGEIRWVISRISPGLDSSGNLTNMLWLSSDITERKRAEEAQQGRELQFLTIVQAMNEGVMVVDNDDIIQFVNQRYCEQVGYTREELLGEVARNLLVPEEHRHIIQRENLARTRVISNRYEIPVRKKSGETIWLFISGGPLTDIHGNVIGSVGIHTDITEHKKFESHLTHMANHDPLTNLFNRRRFEEELDRCLVEAKRHGLTGAILWMDLDKFKDVNDRYGHRYGDDLLVALAHFLRGQVRESDFVSRLGGDEFAILMPHANAQQAQVTSNRILQAMSLETWIIAGEPIEVSASIGIALYPEHGNTYDLLMTHADRAMYQAKEAGRNRSCMWEPETQ